MQNNNNHKITTPKEYYNGITSTNGEEKCLHATMLHFNHNNQQGTTTATTTSSLAVTPIQFDDTPLPPPPPAYSSLSPPPPAYTPLPPSPPPYSSLPSPPPYDTLFPPPPPYSPRPSRSSSSSSSSFSPRPTLPPIRTLLSCIGCALPSPPAHHHHITATTDASPRLPVFHARYYSSATAQHRKDASRDRHALFVLTSPSTSRGLYLGVVGSRRRGLRFHETLGDAPQNYTTATEASSLRVSKFLGSVAAQDVDALGDICQRVYKDTFPVAVSAGRRKPQPRRRRSCRFLLYTVEAPPPPYSERRAVVAEPLASASHEWAAAVIALAQSDGLLLRD
ncbi:hypothetical protein MY10362_000601 [Beauveria mimosiformis]